MSKKQAEQIVEETTIVQPEAEQQNIVAEESAVIEQPVQEVVAEQAAEQPVEQVATTEQVAEESVAIAQEDTVEQFRAVFGTELPKANKVAEPDEKKESKPAPTFPKVERTEEFMIAARFNAQQTKGQKSRGTISKAQVIREYIAQFGQSKSIDELVFDISRMGMYNDPQQPRIGVRHAIMEIEEVIENQTMATAQPAEAEATTETEVKVEEVTETEAKVDPVA